MRVAFDVGGARLSLAKHVPADVASRTDLRYDAGNSDVLLDVFYPAEIEGSTEALPTVIWVHGGGWVSGTRVHIANYLRILAGKGFTTVGVDYSIAPGATFPTPLRQLSSALAYLTLLEDQYPPFGDASYPTAFEVVDPPGPRDRLTVALRMILVIPHIFVLLFVMIGWWFVTVAAWFIILFTGTYPRAMYDFSTGAFKWMLRVQAYLLLLVDEYPPFSLE